MAKIKKPRFGRDEDSADTKTMPNKAQYEPPKKPVPSYKKPGVKK